MPSILVKWNKQQYTLTLAEDATVGDLRVAAFQHTCVAPQHQRWAGNTALSRAGDADVLFGLSGIREGTKLMMIGTELSDAQAFQEHEQKILESKRQRQEVLHRQWGKRIAELGARLMSALDESRSVAIDAAIAACQAAEATIKMEAAAEGTAVDSSELDALLDMARNRSAALRSEEQRAAEEARLAREAAELAAAEAREAQRISLLERDPTAYHEVTLSVLPAAGAGGRPELETSNRIVLPSNVLADLMSKRVETPFTFRVTNPLLAAQSAASVGSGSETISAETEVPAPGAEVSPFYSTHVGVLDFTGLDGIAFLPRCVMLKLRLEDGTRAVFRTVSLPKAEFVRLQPLPSSPARESLNPQQRDALLEFHLRKYHAVTVGDLLTIPLSPTASLRLRCLAASPSSAVSLMDTDVTTDIALPGISCIEGETPGDADWVYAVCNEDEATAGEDLSQSGSLSITALEPGVPVEGVCLAGALLHFTVEFMVPKAAADSSSADRVLVECRARGGDPDLYLSCVELRPGRDRCDWFCVDGTSDKLCKIPLAEMMQYCVAGGAAAGAPAGGGSSGRGSSGGFIRISLNIGVCAYGDTSASFTIRASLEASAAGDSSTSSTLSTEHSNGFQCPTCGRNVPESARLLHEAQCARRNRRCDGCGVVLEAGAAYAKHQATAHQPVVCPCGSSVAELGALPLHRAYECPIRLSRCLYCEIKVRESERPSHLSECGSRSVRCTRCSQKMRRWEFKAHLEGVHDVEMDMDSLFSGAFEYL
eukprot:NODE_337_length_2429_cov_31.252521_g312_i0.p1 GENE.NODE_337_length_2429_cov_31.252521_g312_i0~~NODE_337_length_2429_cov_31.252521_g312_i0.p1  ORF type:complete len:767 (+),score=156.28 NODE_337_length_2429_cov_31.252521_g312_i0:116-2416(+)